MVATAHTWAASSPLLSFVHVRGPSHAADATTRASRWYVAPCYETAPAMRVSPSKLDARGMSSEHRYIRRQQQPSVAHHHRHCGRMPRRMVLESPMFMEFFTNVEVANFEIASDAFSTFKVGVHGRWQGPCHWPVQNALACTVPQLPVAPQHC
eukprot:351955-Chlamydomonas_euryale.AAC.13